MSPATGIKEEALMRNAIEGSEGYGVLRVFGAVAALVALYGLSLSAAALMDPPRKAAAKSVASYGPVTAAMEERSHAVSASAPVRGRSFWISSATGGDTTPANAIAKTYATASFWREREADQVVNDSKLAGDLDRIHGSM
jgi:hypothetical protein